MSVLQRIVLLYHRTREVDFTQTQTNDNDDEDDMKLRVQATLIERASARIPTTSDLARSSAPALSNSNFRKQTQFVICFEIRIHIDKSTLPERVPRRRLHCHVRDRSRVAPSPTLLRAA